ncbi:cis_trans_EpsD, peptidyl-prolyl cis-trans isomerase, EpsD family [Comamonadaceae bacterium]
MMKHTRFSATLLATAIALTLVACGDKEGKKVATQVAAKVGSEEISVHQINQVLSRTNTGGASPEAVQAMGKEVLEKLIDQQLAVDQATENKLHRSPEVVAQIEAARRDILARAYIQQVSAGIAKPTAEEAKKYYVDHPQLFSERRIFNVQEIVAPNQPGVADLLKSHVAGGKSLEEIAAALKAKAIQFNGGSATRAAEQIPLDVLPKIHALKDGQATVIEAPQAITVVRVVSSQASAVAEAAALPRIEQFLTNQRAGEAVATNIKQLRSTTKIAYMGEFEKGATPVAAPATPATPAPDAAATDDKTKSVIEKGVSGLK